jgi:periplasmic divalent cation tolerance protein
MIIIYVPCKDKIQAQKIGRHLLKKRLAACVNIFPEIESTYWGKGKLETAKEAVLLIKTLEKNFSPVEREVTRLHSYKVPCIFSIKANRAYPPYLDWLKKQTKS